MKKYGVWITYKATSYIEIEANTPEQAEELAYERSDEAQPHDDPDYEYEVMEITDEGV